MLIGIWCTSKKLHYRIGGIATLCVNTDDTEKAAPDYVKATAVLLQGVWANEIQSMFPVLSIISCHW